MIKGVILDLDGTLIDSMGMWFDIDRRFLVEQGVTDPPSGISWKIKQMTIENAAEFMISSFGLDMTPKQIIRRIEELVREEYEHNIPLKKGAAELIAFLDEKGIPYGTATATYKGLAEAAMRRCGILDGMSFLLTDKEYPNGKGFPDIFLGAAELLGTAPSETLVIEDSIHCIETASGAGFITAAVYDKASDAEWEKIKSLADHSFMELGEVRSLFEDMENE
ncbi:MAG: HAD family phosphatase [Ruminococcus sp.]|nr:HAD family phosphatase [Ruminococcus sp.]